MGAYYFKLKSLPADLVRVDKINGKVPYVSALRGGQGAVTALSDGDAVTHSPVNKVVNLADNVGGCGISRIYHYEVSRGAEFYLSKSTYAWKRGEVDLSANLPLPMLDLYR
jgi:hypothetical protein